MKKISKTHPNQQSGLVALVVTMLLVMILTIIILAFSSFSRREATETFERQLSSEAFYAAESGISNAIELLKDTPAGTGLLVNPKDDCDSNLPGFEYSLDDSGSGADEAGNVGISCLLIDPAPYSVEISNLSLEEPYVVPLQQLDGNALGQVTVHWHEPAVSNNPRYNGCDASNELPQSWYGNCEAGMLRVELLPVDGAFDYNDLATDTKVVFVKPVLGGGNPTYAWGALSTGDIRTGRCNQGVGFLNAQNPKRCVVRFSNLNGTRYYMRITPLYLSASLTICTDICGRVNTGQTQRLAGAQAKIDSTGRASGVLRRIQVQVDISGLNENSYAPVGIGSTDGICKRFSTRPTSATTGNVARDC